MNLQSKMKMNTLLLLATLLFSCDGNKSGENLNLAFDVEATDAKIARSSGEYEVVLNIPPT